MGPPFAKGLPAAGGIIAGPGPSGELRSRLLMDIGPPPDGDGSIGWWGVWYICGPGTLILIGGVPDLTAAKCGGMADWPACLYGEGILPRGCIS